MMVIALLLVPTSLVSILTSLDSWPAGYHIAPKALNYGYIHNNGAVTNIDRIVCSAAVSFALFHN